MNTHPGILGKKLGCTQIFNDDGSVVRVTVIEAGPCIVVAKRTEEQHKYSALQLSFGEKRETLVTKPMRGYFANPKSVPNQATVAPRVEKNKRGKDVGMLPRELRELRLPADVVAKYEVGQVINITDVLKEGQFIDVTGISRGRGFSGVFRRHNFKGFVRTHGTHEYRRHGGSIGTNMTPGRTMPGKKMPGHDGNVQCTTLNLKVAKIIPDQNLLLVTGAVPGARNGTVVVRGAVKGGKHA